MRFLRVVAAAAVLVAGCATTPQDSGVGTSAAPPAPPPFAFLPTVTLTCAEGNVLTPVLDAVNSRSCDGFGEPVLDVAGDGAIWYSATCCVGRSPPIWVSRDGGVSFQLLPFAQGTGAIRDSFGIEGDFAIDDAGNVYFSDIGAAFPYITQYRADGTHVHSSTFPMEPLVDRPWIRAGAENEAFFFYNTGFATNFQRSTDGGRTWDVVGITKFPCNLMSIGQSNTDRNVMAVAGCPGAPRVWKTTDGGVTWDAGPELPRPDRNGTATAPLMQPAFTDDGKLYVTFGWRMEESNRTAVWLASAEDGTLLELSPPGNVFVPWAAGGRGIGVAWYHTNATSDDMEDAEWFLQAASVEFLAGGPRVQTVYADPEIVHRGPLGRQLGDFNEARMTPDGKFAISYGRDTDGLYQSMFVQSDGALMLGPATFLNGPHV